MRQEWRDFDNEEQHTDKSRAEIVDDLIPSLGTQISTKNFGSTAQSSEGILSLLRYFHKIQCFLLLVLFIAKTLGKYQKLLVSGEDRNIRHLEYVAARVNELGEQLGLSTIIKKDAQQLLKEFEQKRVKTMKVVLHLLPFTFDSMCECCLLT
jgi:hypothetical protein